MSSIPPVVVPAPRAKIVCTLGPASSSPELLRALVLAGMDVARINLSHGTHEAHAAAITNVRAASDAAHRAVGVLADLSGPKIRLRDFPGGPVKLEEGAEFTITTETVPGDVRIASTTYDGLARDVKAGDLLLVDDGLVRLEALSSDGVRVVCRVVEGGVVSNGKGINLPGVRVSAPTMTPKDHDDLRFALNAGVDLVALSFVRSPKDIEEVHRAMDAVGRRVPVIAKIEKPEAVEQLEAIVAAFDGLMVARGDLGVEMPLEQVPFVQKRAVVLAREHRKPVIVATQMLESMIHHSRPTRAEASDVANAVFDGADAVMLSGETGVGEYPVEAVDTMRRIVSATEPEAAAAAARASLRFTATGPAALEDVTMPQVVAAAAVRAAHELNARALVAFTRTGASARNVAAHREHIPLLVFTSDPAVRSQLTVVWGAEVFIVPDVETTDQMVAIIDEAMLRLRRGKPGDLVVLVAGMPPGVPGQTNALRVHRLSGSVPANVDAGSPA
jgi:pyruvate kinase